MSLSILGIDIAKATYRLASPAGRVSPEPVIPRCVAPSGASRVGQGDEEAGAREWPAHRAVMPPAGADVVFRNESGA